jgi:hypothetical protein
MRSGYLDGSDDPPGTEDLGLRHGADSLLMATIQRFARRSLLPEK